MKKQKFNRDWYFWKDGFENEKQCVQLPHDAMIFEERLPNLEKGNATGFYPGGKYVYTKTFYGDSYFEEKKVLLEFEGVYMKSTVLFNDEEYCVYNKKGEKLYSIPNNEENYIGNFSEGLAVVTKNGTYGYINAKGEEVIPFIYDYATSLTEGLAVVAKDNKEYILKVENDSPWNGSSKWAEAELKEVAKEELIPEILEYTDLTKVGLKCMLFCNLVFLKNHFKGYIIE